MARTKRKPRPSASGPADSEWGRPVTLPVIRQERVCLAVIVLIGAVLRFGNLSDIAVEHFDEGVYASNIWFDADNNFQYPDRQLYAPPLMPSLIEFSLILLETGSWGTMLPGLLAGTASLLAIWWLGREWFHPPIGLAAAAVLALSEYHVLYSRTALTEPALGLFWLLAVYAAHRAILSPSWVWVLPAGILAGLAWWTKYNGWITLAIAASAVIPWLLTSHWQSPQPTDSGRRPNGLRPLARTLAVVVVAVVVWSPVLANLQPTGGYASVAANHRQYFVGFAGWWNSFLAQCSTQAYLSGVTSSCGLLLAATLLGWCHTWREDADQAGKNRLWASLSAGLLIGSVMAILALCLGLATVLAGLAILGCGSLLSDMLRPADAKPTAPPSSPGSQLGCWMLTSWIVGLTLATPLYRPYPRLMLPWLLGIALGAILGLSVLVRAAQRRLADSQSVANISAAVSLVGMVVLVGLLPVTWRFHGWDRRDGLRMIAPDIVRLVNTAAQNDGFQADQAVIYVYAEPGLFYHLKADGFQLCAPAGNLDFMTPAPNAIPYPTFLVAGPHADRSETFHSQVARFAARLELLQSFEYRASDLVRLNELPASALRSGQPLPAESIRLWRCDIPFESP